MRFALFKEVPKRVRRKKRRPTVGEAKDGETDEEEQSEPDVDGEDEDEVVTERMSKPAPRPQPRAKSKAKETPATQSSAWRDDSQDVQMDVDGAASADSDGKLQPQRCAF